MHIYSMISIICANINSSFIFLQILFNALHFDKYKLKTYTIDAELITIIIVLI